jgi:alpha-glucosidase
MVALQPPGRSRLLFLENHDQRRAASYLGPREALRAATVLMMTLDGTPLLFCGQEIGSTASTFRSRLFERNPIVWEEPDAELLTLVKALTALRRHTPALRRGPLEPLMVGPPGLVAFTRGRGEGRILVAVNLDSEPVAWPVQGLPSASKPLLSSASPHEGYRLMKQYQWMICATEGDGAIAVSSREVLRHG